MAAHATDFAVHAGVCCMVLLVAALFFQNFLAASQTFVILIVVAGSGMAVLISLCTLAITATTVTSGVGHLKDALISKNPATPTYNGGTGTGTGTGAGAGSAGAGAGATTACTGPNCSATEDNLEGTCLLAAGIKGKDSLQAVPGGLDTEQFKKYSLCVQVNTDSAKTLADEAGGNRFCSTLRDWDRDNDGRIDNAGMKEWVQWQKHCVGAHPQLYV